jgi:hypothetical protein
MYIEINSLIIIMDADSIIVFTASSLGAYQLAREFSDVYNMKKVDGYTPEYVISGIATSILWGIYQYRNGSKYYAMYSLTGVLLGLYTLVRIRRLMEDEPQMSFLT